jgi:hypothetical protein
MPQVLHCFLDVFVYVGRLAYKSLLIGIQVGDHPADDLALGLLVRTLQELVGSLADILAVNQCFLSLLLQIK